MESIRRRPAKGSPAVGGTLAAAVGSTTAVRSPGSDARGPAGGSVEDAALAGSGVEADSAEAAPVTPETRWSQKEITSHIISLGLLNLPGEEFALRFLEDTLAGSTVPPPWEMCRDERSNLFFYNPTSGASSWRHPLEPTLKELVGVSRVCLQLPVDLRDACINTLTSTWKVEAAQVLEEWFAATDAEGRQYYCNRETDETMWEHPFDVLLPGISVKLAAAEWLKDSDYILGVQNNLRERVQVLGPRQGSLENKVVEIQHVDQRQEVAELFEPLFVQVGTVERQQAEDAARAETDQALVREQLEAMQAQLTEAIRHIKSPDKGKRPVDKKFWWGCAPLKDISEKENSSLKLPQRRAPFTTTAVTEKKTPLAVEKKRKPKPMRFGSLLDLTARQDEAHGRSVAGNSGIAWSGSGTRPCSPVQVQQPRRSMSRPGSGSSTGALRRAGATMVCSSPDLHS